MVRQLFWMTTGAALGLYGRRKAITAVEQHVPPRVVNMVNRTVANSVQSFLADVSRAQAAARAAGRDTTPEQGPDRPVA